MRRILSVVMVATVSFRRWQAVAVPGVTNGQLGSASESVEGRRHSVIENEPHVTCPDAALNGNTLIAKLFLAVYFLF